MLVDVIKSDINKALKHGDAQVLSTLRMVFATIQNKGIEKRSVGKELTDEDVIEVLRQEVKKRKETISLAQKGDREDLVKKEGEEIKIIEKYLPQLMSSDEILKVVRQLAGNGLKDFNSLMKESMKLLKGKADGKEVAEAVKKVISE